MRRFTTVLAFCSIVALSASACTATKDTGFPPTPTPSPSPTETGGDTSTLDNPAELSGNLEVGDNFFLPRFVKVTAGATVTWENQGQAPHNIVADDGSFDSNPDCAVTDVTKCLAQGATFAQTFAKPGEYPYYCVIHGAPGSASNPALMAGVIIVE